jgi:hypothetical protein
MGNIGGGKIRAVVVVQQAAASVRPHVSYRESPVVVVLFEQHKAHEYCLCPKDPYTGVVKSTWLELSWAIRRVRVRLSELRGPMQLLSAETIGVGEES